MPDQSDYIAILNAFAQANLKYEGPDTTDHPNHPKIEIDPEKHHSIRVGHIIFWFESESLIRLEFEQGNGISRRLTCQPLSAARSLRD